MIRRKVVLGAVVAGLALVPAPLALAEEAVPALDGQEEAVEASRPEEPEAAPASEAPHPASGGQLGEDAPKTSEPASTGAAGSGAETGTSGPGAVDGTSGQKDGLAPGSAGAIEAHGAPAMSLGTDGDATSDRIPPQTSSPSTGTCPTPEAEKPAQDLPAAAKTSAVASVQVSEVLTGDATPPAGTASVSESLRSADAPRQKLVNVYRLYNPNSGEHFYTTNVDEATHVFSVGWHWEAAVYTENDGYGTDVYRLYNPNAGAHFYTVSAQERDHLVSLGWRYEGVSWRASGERRLFRLYNPNSPIGEHLYTANRDESDHLRSLGWHYEGYAWSYLPGTQGISARWVVSPAYGSLERYWIQRDTNLAKNRYISPSEGTGYATESYATGSGAVVRNKARVGAGVMFADNDGRLTALPQRGWWNTSSVDGSPQWYYIGTISTDSTGRAVVGALTGWLTRNGAHCYALPDQGYLARDRSVTIDGRVYVFGGDGRPDKYGYQNRAGFYRVSSNNVWLGHAGNPFNYVTPSRIGVDATREDCVNAFIQRAREYLGTPYVWDYAREPGVGVDCVGLVMQCAYATGMDLGDINPYNHYYTGPNGWHSHDANNLWNSGRAMHVGLGSRQRGDVISWPGHVAIYLGNDQIIEAYSPRTGVRQTSMWSNGTPRGVIRLFQ